MCQIKTLYKLIAMAAVIATSVVIQAEAYQPKILAAKVQSTPIEDRTIPADELFDEFDGVIRPDSYTFDQGYWIKVLPPEKFQYARDGLFVINPITLYNVDLYIPSLNNSAPIHSVSRFDVKVDERYTRRSSIFELPIKYESNSPIYFYIETAGPQTLHLSYMHRSEYQKLDNKHNTLYSVIFGCLLILIFTNLFIYFTSKSRSYLYYVFYLSALLYVLLMTTGELYQYHIATYVANTYPKNLAAYFLLTIFSLLFAKSFMQVEKLSVALNKIFNFCIFMFSILTVACLMTQHIPPWFVQGVQYLMLLNMLFLIYVAIRSAISGNPRAFYYLIAFLPLILMFVLRILATLEFLPANRFTINGFQIAIIFQALVLSLGLAHDIFTNLKDRENIQQLSASTSNVLGVEKEFTTFLSRFTDTLTPENFREQDDMIVRSYFERLKKVYGVSSGVLIYEGAGEQGIFTDSDETHDLYDDYLSIHRSVIMNTCKGEKIENISQILNPDDKSNNYYAIPVHNANLIWCGLIVAFPHYKNVPNSTFNEIHRFSTELVRTFVNLYQLSVSVQFDQLTKTMSRSGILNALEKYQNLEPRLTIVVFNIRNFKNLNRNFGFQSGDSCLLYLAYLIRKETRSNVKCGRVSSSEFMLVFRNEELEDVQSYVKSVYRDLSPVTVDRGVCKLDLQFSIVESFSPHNLAESLLAIAEEDLRLPVSTEIDELFTQDLQPKFA